MTSAENKEYRGGGGLGGQANAIHVSVCDCLPKCVCVRACVGVPARMFACLHVTECLKLVSADAKHEHESGRHNKSRTKEEFVLFVKKWENK